jgi:nucleoside-diphosphate kinase
VDIILLGAERVADLERTLVIVKPDGVQRGLVGEIVGRLERRGLKIVAMEFRAIDLALASRHYAEHEGKDFYAGLVDYITSGPSVIMVLEGPRAIEVTRSTVGSTRPWEATPGSIRADYGLTVGRNLVHASDSIESGRREVALFFEGAELPSWSRDLDRWFLDG